MINFEFTPEEVLRLMGAVNTMCGIKAGQPHEVKPDPEDASALAALYNRLNDAYCADAGV